MDDLVFAASWIVNSKLLKEGLIISERATVEKLMDNTYKVNKVMNKKIDSTS